MDNMVNEKPEQKAITVKSNAKQVGSIIIGSVVGGVIGSVLTFSLVTAGNNGKLTFNTGANSNTQYNIENVENPVVAISETVSPSVVGIKVKYVSTGFFGALQESEGQGSGIVYSKDGYIITNYHVVEEAISNSQATLEVYFSEDNKTGYSATVVGGDELTDLAVIKLDDTNGINLVPATLGNSTDLKVGEIAVAIGNPLGLDFAGTVTGGYVSGVNREITSGGKTYNLIQTDAAINAGNSGGALVNSKGEIIGINSAKINATGVEGIGFAIPIDTAKPIIEQLIQNKKVARPYVGITGINIDKATAEKYKYPQGIYVQNVEKGSPAELAGVQRGDIIIKVDGKDITTMEELNEIKYNKNIGDKLELVVSRSNSNVDVTVVLGEE